MNFLQNALAIFLAVIIVSSIALVLGVSIYDKLISTNLNTIHDLISSMIIGYVIVGILAMFLKFLHWIIFKFNFSNRLKNKE